MLAHSSGYTRARAVDFKRPALHRYVLLRTGCIGHAAIPRWS